MHALPEQGPDWPDFAPGGNGGPVVGDVSAFSASAGGVAVSRPAHADPGPWADGLGIDRLWVGQL